MNDPRDIVFIKTCAFNSLAAVLGISLFFVGPFAWGWVPLYWLVLVLVFVPQYTLMLHCVVHRPLLRKPYRWMGRYITWFLAPFHGQSPETYFAHHMGMHHVEGNLPGDLSSTMKYQRDSFRHWLKYYARFSLFGLFELYRYHKKKNNKKLARKTLTGEACWGLFVGALCFVNLEATVTVFIGPLFLVRALMMAGNWGQHAFIDRAEPGNDFKSSISCVNTFYNRRCFNDGYHIVHHRRASMHYTEMRAEFEQNLEFYGKQDAIVFDGLDFFSVWLLLMLKRHRTLAARMVDLPGAIERSIDQKVSFLKGRLEPFSPAA